MKTMMRFGLAGFTVLVAAPLLLTAPPARAQNRAQTGSGKIVTSGTNAFNGVDINNFLGANRFYAAGYTGTRSTVANIEGGQIWNGHETLAGRVSQYLYTPPLTINGNPVNRQGNEFDLHATLVGQIIGGNGTQNYQRGVAYGANLWSGGIATDFTGYTNGAYNTDFTFTDDRAFAYPYVTAMQTGINGVRADVVNSSWGAGFLDGRGNAVAIDPNGQSDFSKTLDGLVRANGTTFVVASGDEGPGPNTISYPASAYNALVVGSTTSSMSNPLYGSVASFSSRGPSSAFTPLAPNEINPVRARVDIVAPGTGFTTARYGGATGGNTGAPTSDLTPNTYLQNVAGTSVSAPTVAGGAALLADYGRANFGANSTSDAAINGVVLKAVLLNSADKLAGFNNNQTVVDGHIETAQGLDYAQGAGQLNLSAAFDQYALGTHDVAGLGGGVNLAALGWDYGAVALNAFNDYQIGNLQGGTNFTATLDWFINRQFDGIGVDPTFGGFLITQDNGFAQLSLELYRTDINGQNLVARSFAPYNNVQHFFVNTPVDGSYFLRVAYAGNRYGTDTTQAYGLAWSGTRLAPAASAPEPTTLVLVLVFGGTVLLFAPLRLRRRN